MSGLLAGMENSSALTCIIAFLPKHCFEIGSPLQSNKEMKKAGRGSMDYKSDINSGIVVTTWLDNNCVHIASNFVGIDPLFTIERWCTYNKASMRGVILTVPNGYLQAQLHTRSEQDSYYCSIDCLKYPDVILGKKLFPQASMRQGKEIYLAPLS
eukprot:gene5813-11114_t